MKPRKNPSFASTDPLQLPAYRQALSRRSMLKASLGAGLVAAVPGLACGSGDVDVFAGTQGEAAAAPTQAPVPTTAPLKPAPAEAAAAEPTEAEPTEAPTEAPTQAPTEPPALPTTALAAGAIMDIAFTYEMASGGKQLPPYVAVWIEDADGTLLETVALWYQQDRKGPRWLPDLKRWYTRDQDRITAGGADLTDQVSSATRLPGAYNLAWNGSIGDVPAAAGSYFVCIESARERGPYSLIRQPVELAGGPVAMELPADGELSAASISVA